MVLNITERTEIKKDECSFFGSAQICLLFKSTVNYTAKAPENTKKVHGKGRLFFFFNFIIYLNTPKYYTLNFIDYSVDYIKQLHIVYIFKFILWKI